MPRTRRDVRGISCAIGLAAVTASLAGLAVVLTARFGFPALPALGRADGNAYDFGIFYRSTVALWTGGEVYPSGQPNFAPPVTMVALGPLALLQAQAAYRVFVVVSVAALLAALAWVGQSVRLPVGSAVIATGVLLASPAAIDTLAQGQLYPLLGLGLVAAWVFQHQDRGRASGVALGLVVAFKPVFVAVLLWPLLRHRRDAFVTALFAAAAATALGVVAAGPAATLRYVAVLRAGFPHEDLYNASLLTTGLRLFTPGRDVPPVLDAPVLGWVVALVAVAVLVITLTRGRHNATDLWAITAACLVASPLAWRGYLVVLYPGVLVLLAAPRMRTIAVPLLAALSVPVTAVAVFDPRTPAAVLATLLLPATLLALWAALYGAGDADGEGMESTSEGPTRVTAASALDTS